MCFSMTFAPRAAAATGNCRPQRMVGIADGAFELPTKNIHHRNVGVLRPRRIERDALH